MLHYFPYISLTILIKHRKYSIYSKKVMIILLSLKNDEIHGNASLIIVIILIWITMKIQEYPIFFCAYIDTYFLYIAHYIRL